MAVSMRFDYKGFQFWIHIGLIEGDGVCVDPNSEQEITPEFLAAFKEVLALYPQIDREYGLYETVTYHLRKDVDINKYFRYHDLEDLQEICDIYSNLTYYPKDDPAIAEYCQGAAAEIIRREAQVRLDAALEEKRKKPGYVYLIQSPTNAYKIGRAKDPKNRMATFGVQLPFEVQYVCLIPTDDMRGLEKELHQRFASKRVNGEWFSLAPEDVDYVKGLARAKF